MSASVHAGIPPPEQTPPPGADTHPPEADSGIRSMSDRYASYWNAFLLEMKFKDVLYIHVLILSLSRMFGAACNE